MCLCVNDDASHLNFLTVLYFDWKSRMREYCVGSDFDSGGERSDHEPRSVWVSARGSIGLNSQSHQASPHLIARRSVGARLCLVIIRGLTRVRVLRSPLVVVLRLGLDRDTTRGRIVADLTVPSKAAPHRRRRRERGQVAKLKLRPRLAVRQPRRRILSDRRAVDEERGHMTFPQWRSQRPSGGEAIRRGGCQFIHRTLVVQLRRRGRARGLGLTAFILIDRGGGGSEGWRCMWPWAHC